MNETEVKQLKNKAYREKNKERIAAYRKENKDRIREYMRAYKKTWRQEKLMMNEKEEYFSHIMERIKINEN